MAATDHTRLRTARSSARAKSTDNRRNIDGCGLPCGALVEAPRSPPASAPTIIVSDVRIRPPTPSALGLPHRVSADGTRSTPRRVTSEGDVARAFGTVLREARRARGLSQEALGGDAEVDRTYPSLLENGRRVPTLAVFFRLCRALRYSPADLITATVAKLDGCTPAPATPGRVAAQGRRPPQKLAREAQPERPRPASGS